MSEHVLFEVTWRCAGVVTLFAMKRLFSCMGSHVDSKVVSSCVREVALCANKRLLSAVNLHVDFQVRMCLGWAAALVAIVFLAPTGAQIAIPTYYWPSTPLFQIKFEVWELIPLAMMMVCRTFISQTSTKVFSASTTYEKQLRIEKTRLSHQVWSHGGSTFKKKDIKRPFFPPCRNWPIYVHCMYEFFSYIYVRNETT